MKFTDSHEWLRIEDEMGVMGITKHAQKELGEIVSVELPKVGAQVQKGDPVCVLESTKAAVDVYAPVTGEIVEVNPLLNTSVDLLNTASETEGWLCKIKVFNLSDLESLLSLDEYEKTVV